MVTLWLSKGKYYMITINNSGSAYLTLYNDSHTLIWGLFFYIKQLNNMKDGLIDIDCTHSPSRYNEIPWIGFITCKTKSLFDLSKGSYIIIYWKKSDTAYITLFNESNRQIWGVILWNDEITPRVPMSHCKMSHCNKRFAQPVLVRKGNPASV